MLTNLFASPRTTIAGILIGVVSIAGVLAGQGITFGHVGTGNMVTLIAALATALLGIMARDPHRTS